MKKTWSKNNKVTSKSIDTVKLSPVELRIEQIQTILGNVLQWRLPADKVLSQWFKEHNKVGVRDRGEIAEAVYYVLRHLRRLRYIAESGVGSNVRRLAILGLQAVMKTPSLLDQTLTDAEADWLLHTKTLDLQRMPVEVRHSIPDWLLPLLQQYDDLESLLEALNESAPLDIRVNPLKIDRVDALAKLKTKFPMAPMNETPFSPYGIRIHGRPPLTQSDLFTYGSIEVQDEGSQLLCALVAPKRGEFIIDFCAGAGGKTLLLGAMMRNSGRVYALDVSEKRLSRLKPRLARSELSNVMPMVLTSEQDPRIKRLVKKAHRVLVDAPCSGMGTLRRNPDLKWRQHPDSLAELVELQRKILQSASRCVAPGGRLVYATCSLLAQENQEQIDYFLNNNPDFELIPASDVLSDKCGEFTGAAQLETEFLVLRPDRHQTDGFFAAVLTRKK